MKLGHFSLNFDYCWLKFGQFLLEIWPIFAWNSTISTWVWPFLAQKAGWVGAKSCWCYLCVGFCSNSLRHRNGCNSSRLSANDFDRPAFYHGHLHQILGNLSGFAWASFSRNDCNCMVFNRSNYGRFEAKNGQAFSVAFQTRIWRKPGHLRHHSIQLAWSSTFWKMLI